LDIVTQNKILVQFHNYFVFKKVCCNGAYW